MVNVFIKKNPKLNSLECEYRGLLLIKDHYSRHKLKTPEILFYSENEMHLEKIDCLSPSDRDYGVFAEKLANLHRVQGKTFGLDYDNFIGLNPQKNGWSNDWGDFFVENRLLYQAQLVQDRKLKDRLCSIIENKKYKLVAFLNSHKPKASLVHGDLWSGNALFSSEPYLIDPAVYYGDREVDIAMTQIFGGFSDIFYSSYNKVYPLIKGYEERFIVYNLYHYLNHYNLFGSAYLRSVLSCFDFVDNL